VKDDYKEGRFKKIRNPKGLTSLSFSTSLGIFTIKGDEKQIFCVSLDEGSKDNASSSPLLKEAQKQIEEYLKGERKVFSLPLLIQGTPFQKLVYEETRKIPYGETRTYKEIAKNINHPLAYRAVGQALNKNPLLLLVPCHRVIGSDHSLTGFASGLKLKQQLLDLERRK
jgi:methylated-DNA-[protein]-cysteine S-methyltransferase